MRVLALLALLALPAIGLMLVLWQEVPSVTNLQTVVPSPFSTNTVNTVSGSVITSPSYSCARTLNHFVICLSNFGYSQSSNNC